MNHRTRFAPSPTGDLHIGSARTALYCWLYARHHQSPFLLRIEDTDQERSTPEAVQVILEGLKWLGLDWDEGPVYQMDRLERYRAVAAEWLEKGLAYRCTCSKERLEQLRADQMARKEKPRYDGHCLRHPPASSEAPHVIRFKTPTEGQVSFKDAVRGEVVFQNAELDDLVLIRSDRIPTYNFAVVVDDVDLQIGTVIRGEDHLNNTPRQIHLFQALGAPLPTFAHIPMILGDDGKKLSKRHGAVSVLQYQIDGYLPQALRNYLVRLGWSHGDQEIFSDEEMIRYFKLEDINKAASAFNTEKLNWLNQHYLKTLDVAEIKPHLQWQFDRLGWDVSQGPHLERLIVAQRDRAKTLKEMAEKSRFFYVDPLEWDAQAVKQHLTAAILQPLEAFRHSLEPLPSWQAANLHEVLSQTVAQFGLKLGQLAQPVRVAVTGGTMSPSIDLTLELMGRERVLKRLVEAIQMIQNQ